MPSPFLPEKLTRHDALNDTEKDFLQGLELPPGSNLYSMWRMLTEGVLARRVKGYHADPGALDPCICGIELVRTSLNSEDTHRLFTADEMQQVERAADKARAVHSPGLFLDILIRLDAESRRRGALIAFVGAPLKPEILKSLRIAA